MPRHYLQYSPWRALLNSADLPHCVPCLRIQQAETSFDSGMKDATFIKWASTGETLAVGTAKGNLLLYSKRSTLAHSMPS